ncbi:MAG: hypothetical protein HQL54_08580 [Magnetococcales bacterium]|nr:hypothetical protein [Magnetococcales bacterium]
MVETGIIILPLTGTASVWRTAAGVVGSGSLTEAAQQIAGGVGVWPGTEVTVTSVAMPRMRRRQALKAIPFQLEEGLIDSVESLQFLIGNQEESEGWPVTVVNKAQLTQMQRQLDSANCGLSSVVPEPLLLPWQPGRWSMLLMTDRVVVRIGQWQGFSIDRENISLAMEMLVAETDLENSPKKLIIHKPKGVADIDLPDGLGLSVERVSSAESALDILIRGLDQTQLPNLLSGSYTSLRGGSGSFSLPAMGVLRPYFSSAILFAILLLIGFVQTVITDSGSGLDSAALKKRMTQLYKQTFPAEKTVIDPRKQMEIHLNRMQKGASQSGSKPFYQLMTAFQTAYQSNEGITIQGVNYDSGGLLIQVALGDVAGVDALLSRLRSQSDLSVAFTKSKQAGDKTGVLKISGSESGSGS